MNKLTEFWEREIAEIHSGSGDWLAIMRIGAGITIIAKILSEYHSLAMLYGNHGLIPFEVSSLCSPDFFPTISSVTHMTAHLCTEETSLRLFFGIYFIFSVLMILGLMTRFSAFVCWLIQLIIVNSSWHTSCGPEYLLLSLLFYSLIFPTGRYYSLDNLIRGRTYPTDPLLNIYHLTIQLHVCLIYLATGAAKVVMPTWHDGSYLWTVMGHPQFSTVWVPPLQAILSYGSAAVIMSWFILTLEIIYPIGIWFRRFARPFLVLIIFMHVYIAVAFGLWIFGWLMIVFNLAAFGDLFLDPIQKQTAAITTDPEAHIH
jgi:uncharacterized membrane protein YphA (DoxX/SURF4 family)